MRALLLDLDGTLLRLDAEFYRDYFRLLSQRFADRMDPKSFVAHLLASTERMQQNHGGDKTNYQVFLEDFSARTGFDPGWLEQELERFYRDEFPRLSRWGRPIAGGRQVVEAARRRGLVVVLATDPLFPVPAIEHRVRWAGLDPAAFDLLTTCEHMHFCKPRVEYFQETAERVGVPAGQCLMVGNDPLQDLSAGELGMATFLVEGPDHTVTWPPAPRPAPGAPGAPRAVDARAAGASYRGTLEDVLRLIA